MPYATRTDLVRHGVAAAALTGVATADQDAALSAASAFVDGYLGPYALPLTAWGDDLTMQVCRIAAYNLLNVRGLKPGLPDDGLRDRYDDALAWCRDVSAGRVKLHGVTDATPSTDEGATSCVTSTRRRWSR